MHIPDGFLSAKVAGACIALSAAGVAIASARARRQGGVRRAALMGVTAAFVFAAQMVNFPVVLGTSGHLLGAALATALLGVGPAVIVMTSVLVVQALAFGDGGLLALGANVLNMGVLGPALAGLVLSLLGGRSPSIVRRLAALGCAAWSTTVLASLLCAGELAWSGTAPARAVFPAMAGVHALIGVGEAFISVLVMAAIVRARPEVVQPDERVSASVIGVGLVASLAVALFVAPFACPWPDGLERIAAKLGFEGRALAAPAAPATALLAATGALAMFAACWLVGRWLLPKGERS
jgi:cobalt/nickel transport system permease protein